MPGEGGRNGRDAAVSIRGDKVGVHLGHVARFAPRPIREECGVDIDSIASSLDGSRDAGSVNGCGILGNVGGGCEKLRHTVLLFLVSGISPRWTTCVCVDAAG